MERPKPTSPSSNPSETPPVPGLVEHLFRRESGKLVSTLTRLFGPSRLDLAEDVVQEALVKALKHWSWAGPPREPAAWLFRTARNLALDAVRRESSFSDKEAEIRRWSLSVRNPKNELGGGKEPGGDEFEDDQLRMIFICCHPVIPEEARIALTLKTLGGFGTEEIARAFLKPVPTVAQQLVRAKRRLRESNVTFGFPSPAGLTTRLRSVLEVLYLLFNEGYASRRGDDLLRKDLVGEAIRLTSLLAKSKTTDTPTVQALLSLMLLQAARMTERTDEAGRLCLLEDQNRSGWDHRLIGEGFRRLAKASRGDQVSPYHVQAAIAAEHARASTSKDTDWGKILAHYDRLTVMAPSPIVSLNRAVAVLHVRGPVAACGDLESLSADPRLSDYHLFHAVRADVFTRLDDPEAAQASWRKALECVCSAPERQLMEDRLSALGKPGGKS